MSSWPPAWSPNCRPLGRASSPTAVCRQPCAHSGRRPSLLSSTPSRHLTQPQPGSGLNYIQSAQGQRGASWHPVAAPPGTPSLPRIHLTTTWGKDQVARGQQHIPCKGKNLCCPGPREKAGPGEMGLEGGLHRSPRQSPTEALRQSSTHPPATEQTGFICRRICRLHVEGSPSGKIRNLLRTTRPPEAPAGCCSGRHSQAGRRVLRSTQDPADLSGPCPEAVKDQMSAPQSSLSSSGLEAANCLNCRCQPGKAP